MWNIAENPCGGLKFYTLAGYYYDWGLDIDSNQRHAVKNEAGRSHYIKFRTPRDQIEWLTEAYFDWTYNDFQVRLGKQLVSWGETAESRVADVINPLNTKYLVAFPDWEDFKIGLWMARFHWTPQNLWQDLSFEVIVIPFDFQPQRLAPAGSGLFFGAAPLPGTVFQSILNAQRRDAPGYNIRNCEAGIRIRGYSKIGEGIDWTLSHFYTRLDSPLTDGSRGFSQFFSAFLRGAQGLNPFVDAQGQPINQDIYTYPFYSSTAFTFATTSDFIGASIRGETVYNTNRDYQFGSTGGIKEKDLTATSLRLDWSFMVPYLSEWNNATSYSCNVTGYQYWLLNWERGISWEVGSANKGDSRATKFSLGLSTSFWFGRIIPVFNFVYDVNGNNTVVGALVFQPGDHYQWMVNYQQVNESGHTGKLADQVICSMRYEFW
jgi:hypothetical protein